MVWFFYVKEAKNKPVICKKNFGKELFEGDIYYRYRGRSEKIKFAELRKIFDDVRNSKEKEWFNLLRTISQTGTENAQIINLKNGKIGENIIIDEDALKKIHFIKEGQFNEKIGAPTPKLIGEIDGKTARTGVIKEKEIKVYHDFNRSHPYTKRKIFEDLVQNFSYLKQHYLDHLLLSEDVRRDKTLYYHIYQGDMCYHRFSKKTC